MPEKRRQLHFAPKYPEELRRQRIFTKPLSHRACFSAPVSTVTAHVNSGCLSASSIDPPVKMVFSELL
jgi:hypothetical protein